MVRGDRWRWGVESVRAWARGAVAAAVVVGALVAQGGDARAERPVGALWAALEEAVKAAPAPESLEAIVAEVGEDPVALTAWVRERVRWEPYEGLMRGAEGAARARAGNALDQALLLRALFARVGVEAEIETKALPAAAGKALLAAFAKAGAAASERPRLGAAGVAERGLGGVEEAAAARAADEAAVQAAVEGARRVAPGIVAALGRALAPRRVAAPRAHYWVEAGGVAYDPTGVEMDRSGARVVDARALEGQRHRVVLALVMKRTRAGRAEEEVLLQVPTTVEALAWRPVELEIRPEPEKLGVKAGAADAKALARALAGAGVLRASLLIGEERRGAAAFDRQGRRHEVADDGGVTGPAQLGAAIGGFGGGLGGALGGGRPKPKAGADDEVAFEAVVLRVTTKGPGDRGNPAPVHERVLLSGAKGELPVVRVSLLVEEHALAAGQRELSVARALLAQRPAFEALVGGGAAAKVAEAVAAPSEPAGLLMRYADLRRRAQAALVPAAARFRERAGLVALVDRLTVGADGALAVARRFDIFANPVAFVGEGARLDGAAAVAQGVLDTALEATVLGAGADASETAWVALGGASDGLKAARDGRLWRVGGDAAAWWSVDPTSGVTVGRVAGGGGQAMVEYSYKVATNVCEWAHVLAMYAAAKPEQEVAQDANLWTGRICSFVKGTQAQQAASEHIGEVSAALWKIAIPALMGLPTK